jgi:hypothetical protein
MRRAFILLVGSVAAASSVATRAQQPPMMEPTQAMRATVAPQIQMVRVKRVEPAAPEFRSQLRDGEVDLMKGFRLGGPEGIGSGWKMPPTGETFDARYGRW